MESSKTLTSKKVFITGAGFSKDVAELPLLTELSNDVAEYFERETSRTNARAHLKFVDSYLKQNIPPQILGNIENLLTLLKCSNPWLKKEDTSFRQGLFLTISSTVARLISEKEASSNPNLSEHFSSLVKFWMENNSVIITFNYDTLIERKASRLYSTNVNTIPSQEFYLGPLTNLASRTHSLVSGEKPENILKLIKLHGSTSWYYSGNENFNGEPIYYDPLFEKGDGRSLADENKIDVEPLIVPPLLDKDSFFGHGLLKIQWNGAFSSLKEATEIYIIGYSLPPTDLSTTFMLQEIDLITNAKWHIFLYGNDSEMVKERYNRVISRNLFFHQIKPNESSTKRLLSLIQE